MQIDFGNVTDVWIKLRTSGGIAKIQQLQKLLDAQGMSSLILAQPFGERVLLVKVSRQADWVCAVEWRKEVFGA